jgi:hypothetical protein
MDPYVVANTGYPQGELVESTGKWAIDPDVFVKDLIGFRGERSAGAEECSAAKGDEIVR